MSKALPVVRAQHPLLAVGIGDQRAAADVQLHRPCCGWLFWMRPVRPSQSSWLGTRLKPVNGSNSAAPAAG
jgi:hypothetical protein